MGNGSRSGQRRPFRAVVTALLLAGLAVQNMGCAERAFFYPTFGVHERPSDYGYAHEPFTVRSRDGTTISAWRIRAAVRPARGTVVQCHGNGGNMTGHWLFLDFLLNSGYDVVAWDYRGYGESQGRPGRPGIVEDGEAVLDQVLLWPQDERGPVALFGQSLGGSVALELAVLSQQAGRPVSCAVIESCFYSWRAVAAHTLGRSWILWPLAWPLSWLFLDDSVAPRDSAPRADCPKLFILGQRDSLVPPRQTRAVYQLAAGAKELVEIEDAGHMGFRESKSVERYKKSIIEFLDRNLGKR